MALVSEVFAFLQNWADVSLAESWDNAGVLVDSGKPVTKVLVTLDITNRVVQEAAEKGCELIVSHHPVIFKPLKRLDSCQPAFLLAQKGISAICMHTNLDAAQGGVNDVLAALFEMQQVEVFGEIGRVGTIPQTTAKDLAKRCKAILHTSVMLADAQKPVEKLAVVGGSGGDFFAQALQAGADCLLTGEASHHHALDAVEAGISVISAGHFATEQPIVKELAKRLQDEFEFLEISVSETNKAPLVLVE